MKWDSLGNKLWHKTYGTPNTDSGFGITKTQDGNYLIAAAYNKNNLVSPWAAKINNLENVIWSNFYGDYGEFWWIKEQSDGSIVSVGS